MVRFRSKSAVQLNSPEAASCTVVYAISAAAAEIQVLEIQTEICCRVLILEIDAFALVRS